MSTYRKETLNPSPSDRKATRHTKREGRRLRAGRRTLGAEPSGGQAGQQGGGVGAFFFYLVPGRSLARRGALRGVFSRRGRLVPGPLPSLCRLLLAVGEALALGHVARGAVLQVRGTDKGPLHTCWSRSPLRTPQRTLGFRRLKDKRIILTEENVRQRRLKRVQLNTTVLGAIRHSIKRSLCTPAGALFDFVFGSSRRGAAETNLTANPMRLRVRSPASLSGWRIWGRHELWCRWQTWLGSGAAVAVVEAGGCSSDSTPSLGTSVCRGCGPKKTGKTLCFQT